MELVVPRSDEKRMVHLHELVSLATEDIEQGKEVLPRSLYDRLVVMEQLFEQRYKWHSRKSGEKTEAIALRNKTLKRLSYLVRDIFIMARRKFERGDLSGEALTLHCIPKGTVNEKGQPGIWITLANELLAGDVDWRKKDNETLLLDPSRGILEQARTQAREALNVANQAIGEMSKAQTEMQELRKQVAHLLTEARLHLIAGFFGLPAPKMREVLFAYGYRFRPGRRKATSPTAPAITAPLKRDYSVSHSKDSAFNYGITKAPPTIERPPEKTEQTTPELSKRKEAIPMVHKQDLEAASPHQTPTPSLPTSETSPIPSPAENPEPDLELQKAITIEATKRVSPKMTQVLKQMAERKAATNAKPGGKPKRKKRPSKSKKK